MQPAGILFHAREFRNWDDRCGDAPDVRRRRKHDWVEWSPMKRRWIFWLLLVGFLWVIISRFTEIEKLVKTLTGGLWYWIIAAALIQVVV